MVQQSWLASVRSGHSFEGAQQAHCPTHHGANHASYDTLHSTTHVFLHHDAERPPLQRPYGDPFLVIRRTEEYFTVNKNGTPDTVSIDHLNPAVVELIPETTSCARTGYYTLWSRQKAIAQQATSGTKAAHPTEGAVDNMQHDAIATLNYTDAIMA